jgi:opacity protein-like surface antigen
MGGELVVPAAATKDAGELRASGNQAWSVRVPDGESRVVDVTVEAVEVKSNSISLRGGFAAAVGQNRSDFDPSLGLALDYEYRINPVAAIGASLRRDAFRGKGTMKDAAAWSGSVELRLYAFESPFRPFIPFGAGVYAFDPGGAKGGVHVGLGAQWDLNPRWAIEAEGTYRKAGGTPSAWTEADLGVRYRF